jgi:hypothetical protein
MMNKNLLFSFFIFLLFFQPQTQARTIDSQNHTALPAPEFSATAGFYDQPFFLEITLSDPSAEIRYTLDGSKPHAHSQVYAGQIYIQSREDEANDISMIPTNNNGDPGPPYYEGWQPPLGQVFKVNVVRAAAFVDQQQVSPITTATFLVDELGNMRYSLALISITTDWENLFDPDIGIYVPGNYNNYFQKGSQWEREVHMEFFEPDGSLGFAQDVGIRIHGGTTRSRPRKSLRVYARSDYGNSRISYQLFPDKPIADFNRLLLRNSGNDWDWAIFRDAFMQHLARNMNVDRQYYRPAIVFINGEYWGIHNMRDRYDEHYIQTHYGIDPDNLVILENNAAYYTGDPSGIQHYVDMVNYINHNSMAIEGHYREVTRRMDPWSFIDSQITNIFVMNTDWPGNNNLYWRYIKAYDADATPPLDGRWRWMLLDLDFGFGLPFHYVPGVDQGPAHNTLAMAADPNGPSWPNPPWSTLLLRNLLENTGFRYNFINRFADLLNTDFHQHEVIAVIDSIRQILQPEMQEHIYRWRRPETMQQWNDNLHVMRNFAGQRPGYMRQYIKDFFNLPGMSNVTLSVNDPSMGHLKINTVEVQPDPYWNGTYFHAVPIEVIARPAPGYRLARWEGGGSASGDTLRLLLSAHIEIKAVYESSEDFPGDEFNPAAFRLKSADYIFNYWSPNEPEGSFPPNMIFQQSSKNDPKLEDQMTHPYFVPYLEYHDDDKHNAGYPYRLTRRTRINGLWEEGISFINTGRGRDLGAAVLALDTRDVFGVKVSFTAGTIIPNSRVYAIRLQYRTSLQEEFRDVTDSSGNPIEYKRSEQAGHFQDFSAIMLPQDANNKAYVQLRWKYYFTGQQLWEESGARDMLRLDNISVSNAAVSTGQLHDNNPTWLNQNFPNPFNDSTRIEFRLDLASRTVISLYDQRGMMVKQLLDAFLQPGYHHVLVSAANLSPGIYFYKMQTSFGSQVMKMVVN